MKKWCKKWLKTFFGGEGPALFSQKTIVLKKTLFYIVKIEIPITFLQVCLKVASKMPESDEFRLEKNLD